jgi:hypothetical protein
MLWPSLLSTWLPDCPPFLAGFPCLDICSATTFVLLGLPIRRRPPAYVISNRYFHPAPCAIASLGVPAPTPQAPCPCFRSCPQPVYTGPKQNSICLLRAPAGQLPFSPRKAKCCKRALCQGHLCHPLYRLLQKTTPRAVDEEPDCGPASVTIPGMQHPQVLAGRRRLSARSCRPAPASHSNPRA